MMHSPGIRIEPRGAGPISPSSPSRTHANDRTYARRPVINCLSVDACPVTSQRCGNMEQLFLQIEMSCDRGLYLVGLQAALTVPDICGALAAPDGVAGAARYKKWFDENIASGYPGPDGKPQFTGEACWAFRCGLLHQGRVAHRKLGYSKVLFVEPSGFPGALHGNVIKDAFNIDVRIFCNVMARTGRAWIDARRASPIVQRNLENCVKRYPRGLPGYIEGVSVIG